MKVLQIIGNMGSGGAEKLILDSLPLYRKKGIEMDVLVLNDKEYPFMKALKETACCRIYSLGSGSMYNPIHVFKIIPFLRKYDIAQVHLFPSQYWVVLAKLLSCSKVKLILTEHSTTNPRMENYLLSKIDRFIYRFYCKVICITEEVSQIVYKYTQQSKSKFIVIENGIILNRIYDAEPYSKNKISSLFNDQDTLLIQVARFSKDKDHKTVIKSLQYLPIHVKLLLVGDGILRKDCEDLVQKLELGDRVLFLGVRMDVPRLLKSADISILSTNHEGFGLVAVESMASGKPFIGSDVAGLSSVVKDAGILFEKGNAKELALHIEKLINNPEYYKEVVSACQIRAKQYDIQFMVDKHIQLYQSLVQQELS
jgi:glycosyltransferase involved in cell wall biosynthesis